MGNLLCGINDTRKITSSEQYMQLYQLYQDTNETNKLLARTNRELKRRLLVESKRSDQLAQLMSNLYDDSK